MKLARFSTLDHPAPRSARLDAGTLHVVDNLFARQETGVRVPLSAARLLAPVEPSKVVGVGLNYRAHAAEMNKPLPDVPRLFLKPNTAVLGPDETIVLPRGSNRVDHEAELAVVMGQRARHLTPQNALHHVLGYTCANDVTARDFQQQDVQFTRAKGFDTFCPLGPWLETDLAPQELIVSLTVNGVTRQNGPTSDMIYSVVDLLVFITGVMTLLPGDVIITGTPAGVGPLQAGDSVSVSVSGVGTLTNRVAATPRQEG